MIFRFNGWDRQREQREQRSDPASDGAYEFCRQTTESAPPKDANVRYKRKCVSSEVSSEACTARLGGPQATRTWERWPKLRRKVILIVRNLIFREFECVFLCRGAEGFYLDGGLPKTNDWHLELKIEISACQHLYFLPGFWASLALLLNIT